MSKKNIFFIFISAFFYFSLAHAQSILQIGDSHTVGPMGAQLYKRLSEANYSTRSVGLVGASGSHYASEKRTLNYGFVDRKENGSMLTKGNTVEKLSTYIKNMNPSIVVIELGDNFANYSGALSSPSAENQVKLILSEMEKTNYKKPCFWIGPTWTNKSGQNTYQKTNTRAQALSRIIKKTVEPRCTYIDSLELLKESEVVTNSDGLHMTQKTGTLWGNRAADAILKEMDKPSAGSVTSSRPKKANVNQ